MKKNYDYWVKRNAYYHQFMAQFYRFVVPAKKRVLQVGCKTGNLLHAVRPSFGVGIDPEKENIDVAREKYPQYNFIHGDIVQYTEDIQFDYIILSSTIMEVYDIQDLFIQLQKFCTCNTRIVIDSYSSFWEPILWILQKLGFRRPTPLKNWVSISDTQNFLNLADFEMITYGYQLLLPFYIPLISWLVNSLIATIPLINRLCLSQYIIGRPKPYLFKEKEYIVSVIIPTKNEKGNIEPAVLRTPEMGISTELIFVEGGSKDGTSEEIQRIMQKYPERNIRYLQQTGKGKADAVYLGFENAKGDIFMILDGDLTVPPEELPKFYQALKSGKGEFINGSRLIYGMENGAMRFLNLLANYSFALLFSWILSQRVKDTLCGTKVLFKKEYEAIKENRKFVGDFDPFGDFDLLFGAAKQNLKIVDMPVHYKARRYGETQIRRFYHGLILMKMSLFGFVKFKLRM